MRKYDFLRISTLRIRNILVLVYAIGVADSVHGLDKRRR